MYTFCIFALCGVAVVFCKDSLDSVEKPQKKTKTTTNLEENSDLPPFAGDEDRLLFLQGKFSSSRYLTTFKNPGGDNRTHSLLPQALASFRNMVKAFEEETKLTHPNYKQTIFIVSGFRDFSLQKKIWEGKFTGERKMRQSVKGKTAEEIIPLILEFSSAPGTSRHHWGTDMDINSLQNSYFEKGGKGEVIYQWMMKNASRFGFCQPYNELKFRNGIGYNEEKWHWSYKPASSVLRKMWIEEYNKGNITNTGFLGADVLGKKALDYVSSVSEDCR